MRRFIGSLLLALVLMPVTVMAQIPPIPHAFYGTLTIDGQAAPVGTQVEVWGNKVMLGAQANPIQTTEVGRYGSEGVFGLKVVVQGPITNGTALSFYVNGFKADQTAQWQEGELSVLHLTVDTSRPQDAVGKAAIEILDGTAFQVMYAPVGGMWQQVVADSVITPGMSLTTV